MNQIRQPMRFFEVDSCNPNAVALHPILYQPPRDPNKIRVKLLTDHYSDHSSLSTLKDDAHKRTPLPAVARNIEPVLVVIDPNGNVSVDNKNSTHKPITLNLNPTEDEDDEDYADAKTVHILLDDYLKAKSGIDSESDDDQDTLQAVSRPFIGSHFENIGDEPTPISDDRTLGLKKTDTNYLEHWQRQLALKNDDVVARIFRDEFGFHKLTTYLIILLQLAQKKGADVGAILLKLVKVLAHPDFPLSDFLTHLYEIHLANKRHGKTTKTQQRDFYQNLAFALMSAAFASQDPQFVGRFCRAFTISVYQRPIPKNNEWPFFKDDYEIYVRLQTKKINPTTPAPKQSVPERAVSQTSDLNLLNSIIKQFSEFVTWFSQLFRG